MTTAAIPTKSTTAKTAPEKGTTGIGHAAVGGFVLGGFVLAVAAVLVFGNVRIFNPTTTAIVVFQGSVSGLSVGAPVTFRGVHVGSVTGIVIEFDQNTHVANIPVTVALEPGHVQVTHEDRRDPANLREMIERGLRAELNTQSFVTGQSQIDLDFDPASPATLHPDVTKLLEIPTMESPLNKVKDQIANLPLRELADNANATLKSLRALSEKLDTNLPPLIASLKSTSDRSAQAIDTAVRAVDALEGQVATTLAAFTKVAVTGERMLDQRGAELHVLLTSTNQAILQAHDVLGDVKGLTSNRSTARVNIDSALSDLASASAALRGLANDVEHDPQLLLTGRRP